MRRRVFALGFLFAAGLGALVTRAVDLQLLQRTRFEEMASGQTLRELVLTPRRGRIEDRNGEALALSVDVESVRADPSRIEDPAATARKLAKVLDLDARRLQRRLEQGRYFAWVERRVSPAEAAAVRDLGLPGVGLTREPRRFYPHRELASHLLGFAGIDGKGLEGLELVLDAPLRGTAKSASALRDARGNHLFEPGNVDPSRLGGGTVVLTLDRTLQWMTEKALDRAVRESEAAAGMAVVLEPTTGEILAAATRPTFNPNDPGASSRAARRNRVVTDLYEPGSTFKVFTIAAALDAGVVEPETPFDCERGAARIGGRTIHDSHPYGSLTVADILKVSSNIGSAKIAEQLGTERLIGSLRDLGFGTPTGVRLPGEQRGTLRPARRTSELERATISFGQGVSATPLQVATALSAVANGGRLMRPWVVREVRDEAGEVLESHRPQLMRRVLSEEATRATTEMMVRVVEPGGTGTRAQVAGYRVAGKTGTSQKVDPLTRGYSEDKRVASFAGFLPAEDPRLVIVVVIDEPQGVKYGGLVAAPVFREIAEGAMRYLGIPPTEDLAAPEPETVAAVAESPAQDEGVPLPVGLLPPPEGKTLVPDLAGLDLRRALKLLGERRLEVRARGAGVVRHQVPPAGRIVAPGAAVEIELAPRG